MKQRFTTDSLLIKYLYDDLSRAEIIETEAHLDQDPLLDHEYDRLLEAKKELPKVTFAPSDSCIQSILSYSSFSPAELPH